LGKIERKRRSSRKRKLPKDQTLKKRTVRRYRNENRGIEKKVI